MGMRPTLDFITALFVPADRPERFGKAVSSGTDAVILDLEDAVASQAKEKARASLDTRFTGLPVIVRVNASGTPWHAEDMAAASRLEPAALMLPKTESVDTLDMIARGPAADLPIIALIETACGLSQARAIAAHPAVTRIAFGSVDFCADLGCAHEREALLVARSELVLASRLANLLAPIDGVTTVIDDPDIAADDARYGRFLGFGGKLCIHPKQIAPVLSGYMPDANEIAWANRVLASGDGAAAIDGAMIDEPVRIRARKILALTISRNEGDS